jgi:hypothetical protein
VVRTALLVSVAPREGARARGLVGVVPAAFATPTDGRRAGRESGLTESTAGGSAALVRDALVVSARWRGDDSAIDDANNGTDDSGGYHAASATDATRLDATAAGHVFCLTSLKNARPHACRRAAWCRV